MRVAFAGAFLGAARQARMHEPQSRGRGFMTIQLPDGRKTFTDLRETAPLAATAAWLLFHQQAVAARARPDPERALRAEW
jgi:gamma-glutamyltranspeptidase